jgi:hypothetical protein
MLSRESGMKAVRYITIGSALAFLLAGCGLPFSQIRTQLSPLQGQPLSAATAKLGQPTEERTQFGKRVVIWKKQWSLDSDGDDQECVVQAYMNGDTINEIHFTGDENQCYRFAETLARQ